VYGLAYCGGVVGAESVCSRLLDENSMIARTFLSVKRGHRGEGGHEGFERAAGDVRESRAGSDRGKEHRTEVTEERGHGGFERVGADVSGSRAGSD
jgi:hypothetical protein